MRSRLYRKVGSLVMAAKVQKIQNVRYVRYSKIQHGRIAKVNEFTTPIYDT